MKELLGILYREGLEASNDASIPDLEELVAAVQKRKELRWEDRVFLTLMAFKEEAACKISSW